MNIDNDFDDELRNEIDDKKRKNESYIESKSENDEVSSKIEIEYNERKEMQELKIDFDFKNNNDNSIWKKRNNEFDYENLLKIIFFIIYDLLTF